MTRSKALIFTALLAVTAVLGLTASPARSASKGGKRHLVTLNHQLVAAINVFRAQHGLTPLTVSTDLNAAARQHSVEMGTDGYFDHPSYDGTAFWKRIQSYYSATGYSYWTVGENLLYMSPTISAADALKMWIASPEHKRNLLDKNWRDLGVSAVKVRNAPGVYGGDTVTIITADFGARSSS
jgi:uncharacterized protein YkwD